MMTLSSESADLKFFYLLYQNLDGDMLRTRMASINVLLPNAPMRKPTGHPEDTFWNEPDDPEDHNYI